MFPDVIDAGAREYKRSAMRIRREEHLADPSIATFISNLIEGAVLEMKHHQTGEND
jgi:hypothetical protein